jgi:hypothetical protein
VTLPITNTSPVTEHIAKLKLQGGPHSQCHGAAALIDQTAQHHGPSSTFYLFLAKFYTNHDSDLECSIRLIRIPTRHVALYVT